MDLPLEEPHFGPWEVVPLLEVARRVERPRGVGPSVVAIDGRSASGKTTLATHLARVLPGSTVLHTDDIAWHHSFFDWSEVLLENVLEPARAGREVVYRPAAWQDRGREGAITVPRGSTVVILEGVGAARRELMPVTDSVVWVQSDMAASRTRGLERDGGDAAAEAFWDEWMAAELPFQAEQRPWERADLIVCGTPELAHDPEAEALVSRSSKWAV